MSISLLSLSLRNQTLNHFASLVKNKYADGPHIGGQSLLEKKEIFCVDSTVACELIPLLALRPGGVKPN